MRRSAAAMVAVADHACGWHQAAGSVAAVTGCVGSQEGGAVACNTHRSLGSGTGSDPHPPLELRWHLPLQHMLACPATFEQLEKTAPMAGPPLLECPSMVPGLPGQAQASPHTPSVVVHYTLAPSGCLYVPNPSPLPRV